MNSPAVAYDKIPSTGARMVEEFLGPLYTICEWVIEHSATRDQATVEIKQYCVGSFALCQCKPIPTGQSVQQSTLLEPALGYWAAPVAVPDWGELIEVSRN